MIRKIYFFVTFLSLLALSPACKKCCTCTATDTSGKQVATETYCSTSGTNITSFENSFKSTYGTYGVICNRDK
jgi:hypothetical protein